MLRGVFQSDQKRQVGVGTRLGQGIQGPRQFKVPGMPLGSQGICTPGGRRPEQPGAASDGLLSTPALNALNPTTAWTTARSRPAAAVSVQQAAFRLPAAPLGSPKQAPKEGGPRALSPLGFPVPLRWLGACWEEAPLPSPHTGQCICAQAAVLHRKGLMALCCLGSREGRSPRMCELHGRQGLLA